MDTCDIHFESGTSGWPFVPPRFLDRVQGRVTRLSNEAVRKIIRNYFPSHTPMSVSLWRTVRNAYKTGIKRYAWQIATLGDAKSGDLVGTDDFGNKFYETKNEEEIHLRTRWVEYQKWGMDMSQVEPGWHYWLGYGTQLPPNQLPKVERAYPLPEVHKVNQTGTPGAYVSYNTAKPKCQSWEPKVSARA